MALEIVVTGGLGYVGSGIVQRLLEAGDDVAIVDDASAAKVENSDLKGDPGMGGGGTRTSYTFDITAPSAAKQILEMAQPDVVLHLAAVSGVDACLQDPSRAWDVNVNSTAKIAAWCQETGTPMALASTAGVYDPSAEMPLSPDRPREPPHFYGRTKRAAEDVVEDVLEDAAPSMVIEMTNLYGGHDVNGMPVSKPTVFNFFADRVRHERPLTVHRPGTQTRDFLHVQDAIRAWHEAVFALLDSDLEDHHQFILGTGEVATIEGLAHRFADVAADRLGTEPDVRLVDNPRPGPVYEGLEVDLDDARRVLDWTPNATLEGTIERELLRDQVPS